MTMIAAKQALTPDGWRKDVVVDIGDDGRISSIDARSCDADHTVGVLLPALSNLHSHSFQRAMAGLAERRGPNAHDDFWTWRKVMYRFLEVLSPDDIGDIAALVQMEMLEAGYAAQAEFHYVHHGQNGAHYAQIDETAQRHIEAAKLTGIGYTHLPVLYMQGGLDGRALEGGQRRFGCSLDDFSALYDANKLSLIGAPDDYRLGVAPHSLRAVTKAGLEASADFAPDGPIHIHAAEQLGEVRDVQEALGARPVRWLLDNLPVDNRWCLIHATHLDEAEVDDFAASKAVAGLCPITEANLGDGIFNASRFMEADGAIGVGSDSNVKIALSEELRMLEVSQRLRDKRRVVLTSEKTPSNGRLLYEKAALGGAQALGRDSGAIKVGAFADLVALDDEHIAIAGLEDDFILDSWIFVCTDDLVSDVWSAGRHVVRQGRHIAHDAITETYKKTIKRLRQDL
ncbi:MAG: formimidoylglutamate deiminase [Pseudomonadota bacterium]